MSVIHLESSMT